jgi:hypothetical protein
LPEQIGTDPSHFLPRLSRSLSDARRLLSRSLSDAGRLLSRSLSDAARLLSSPLAGAVGCVFNVFGRLFVLAWVCHLCSSSMSD